MSTYEQTLNENSLKRFVTSAVKAEQQRLGPGQTAQPRAFHQEEIAAFWGFDSWDDLWMRVVTSRSMKSPRVLKSSLAERPLTASRLHKFWPWVQNKGVSAVGIQVGKPLWLKRPKHYTHMAAATTRVMQQEDVECVMATFLGKELDLRGLPEGSYEFFTSMPTSQGQALEWQVKLDVGHGNAMNLQMACQEEPIQTLPPPGGLDETLCDHQRGMLVVSHSFCRLSSRRLAKIVNSHLRREHTTPFACYRPPNEPFNWNPPIDEAHFELEHFWANTTRYTQRQRETLAGQPHVVCIERCSDADTLNQALTASEAGIPVFLGLVGGDDQHSDESLQRVADAVVRLLNTMELNTWKSEAARWIATCHAVVATCNHVEVSETLVFTPHIRQTLLQALHEAATPQDLYAPLVHLTLAHGRDFVDDAVSQGVGEKDLNWIAHVQSEWRDLWASQPNKEV